MLKCQARDNSRWEGCENSKTGSETGGGSLHEEIVVVACSTEMLRKSEEAEVRPASALEQQADHA